MDLREALDEIGADVMAGSSPRRAIRELLRRGMPGMRGLDELRERINRRRNETAAQPQSRRDVPGDPGAARPRRPEERKQLARDLDDDARFAEMQLGNLPPSTAAAVNELGEYQWRSAGARGLREDSRPARAGVARAALRRDERGPRGADENDRQAITDMLADLNELLAKHNRGEDTTDEFAEFMDKHGQFFPENPRNTDELVESLACRSSGSAAVLQLARPNSAQNWTNCRNRRSVRPT